MPPKTVRRELLHLKSLFPKMDMNLVFWFKSLNTFYLNNQSQTRSDIGISPCHWDISMIMCKATKTLAKSVPKTCLCLCTTTQIQEPLVPKMRSASYRLKVFFALFESSLLTNDYWGDVKGQYFVFLFNIVLVTDLMPIILYPVT